MTLTVCAFLQECSYEESTSTKRKFDTSLSERSKNRPGEDRLMKSVARVVAIVKDSLPKIDYV